MKKTFTKNLLRILLVLFLALSLAPSFVLAQGGGTGGGALPGGGSGGGALPGGGTGGGALPGGGSGGGAQPTNITIGNPFKGLGNNGNLSDLLYAVLDNAVIPVGGIIVVLMIIYSGFLFVTARGNEEQLKVAKRSFTYAAIGAAILLGAKAIALAIQSTVNALR